MALWCLCMALAGQTLALKAGERPVATPLEASQPRPLLVLQVARDIPGKERERRLVRELRLVLDDIPVETLDLSNTDFADWGLSRQLAHVRPAVDDRRALAAVWMSQPSANLVILQLVAVSTGRAMVRMVETAPGQHTEANLAVATRELLGAVYLFGASPSQTPAPARRIVESIQRQVAPAARGVTARSLPPHAASRTPNTAVLGGLRMRSGLLAVPAGGSWGGGQLGLERRLLGPLVVRAQLDALAGPLAVLGNPILSGWSAGTNVALAWLWRRSGLIVGPSVAVGVEGELLFLKAPGVAWNPLPAWRVLVSPAMEARWQVARPLWLTAQLGLVAYLQRDLYVRRSNGQFLAGTPWLGTVAQLGLAVDLPGP